MSPSTFGTVLAAQVLYGVLQIVVDNGTTAIGARMAVRGELGPGEKGKVVRIRVILAIAVAPLAMALGALGISGSLAATAPFAAALVLFALFNVWEPYGAGDSRPLATYLAMRSAVPAAVVVVLLATGMAFPQALAGLLECGVVLALILLFRQRPLEQLRLAAGARGGPWRPIASVGVPAVIFQASVAAGTLTLSGYGHRAASGVLAACVRLLTGLNGVNGIVTAAAFPRLVREGEEEPSRQFVGLVLRLIVTVSAVAAGACVLLSDGITKLVFEDPLPGAAGALVLTIGAAAAMSNVPMLSYLLIARGHERELLVSYVLGAAITIGFGIGAVATGGADLVLVALALTGGQLAMMLGLVSRTIKVRPELRTELLRAGALSASVAALAAASRLSEVETLAGALLLLLATVSGWSFVRDALAARRRSAV